MKKSTLAKDAKKPTAKPPPSDKKSIGTTAKELIALLKTFRSEAEQKKTERYFKSGKGDYGEGDVFIGVRMGKVFDLAKNCLDTTVKELEKLLESPIHEARALALSIMNQQARKHTLPERQRQELYDLYLRRHDRINNWDLVDVSAIYVVGRYLSNKPRDILYKLAKSKNMWERRTSIVSTAYFIKQGDIEDTFKIATLLLHDSEDLVHKAVGGWIRQAGSKDTSRPQLLQFLDKYAATMPRTMLRYAIEHLGASDKKYYIEMKSNL